ncbi:MAG: hypothetical protein ACLSVD_06265 [Eggerthellaceae bacterium]
MAVWLGVGLAGFDAPSFGTALWIIAGCMGTWVAAVIAAYRAGAVRVRRLPLDDEEGLDG